MGPAALAPRVMLRLAAAYARRAAPCVASIVRVALGPWRHHSQIIGAYTHEHRQQIATTHESLSVFVRESRRLRPAAHRGSGLPARTRKEARSDSDSDSDSPRLPLWPQERRRDALRLARAPLSGSNRCRSRALLRRELHFGVWFTRRSRVLHVDAPNAHARRRLEPAACRIPEWRRGHGDCAPHVGE